MHTAGHTAVVSTIGTSILTNTDRKELIPLLRETANYQQSEYSQSDFLIVDTHIQQVRERILAASDSEIRLMSAELNGLFAIEALQPDHLHYLLHTDTFQGEQAAKLVWEWLQKRGCRQSSYSVLSQLSTKNQASFSRGVDELLKWCEDTLPTLKEQNYHILFNLVGGFKSLQAYAQTIGMIYADEITYIFESASAEPIRIPRLPISINTQALEDHLAVIARMAEGNEIVDLSEVRDLPEAYLEIDEGKAVLSTWGKLAWNQVRVRLLGGELVEHPGLHFEASFRREYEDCKNREMQVALQSTLAKVAVLWREGGLKSLRSDGGLQYGNLQGGIGHFRINQGDRVTCVPQETLLILRRFGLHDVIDNP